MTAAAKSPFILEPPRNRDPLTRAATLSPPSPQVNPRAVDERLRRDGRIRVLDRPCDLVPVEAAVQVHADPAAVTDVRRAEVVLGLALHQRLLHPGRRRAPDREPAVVVMVVEVHHE